MQNRPPAKSAPVWLSEPASARLLERASELDAARAAGAAVAELRAAAAEAGISMPAFDAALAEVQEEGQAPVPATSGPSPSWPRRWALAAASAALIVVGALALLRTPAPAAGPALVEEAILLRCLSADEAVALIRPILGSSATVAYSPERAPRLLRVRATPPQHQRVRAELDKYESAGSAACAARPAPAAR